MTDNFEHTPDDFRERRARVEANTATPEDYYRLGQYSALGFHERFASTPDVTAQRFGVTFEASAEVIPGDPK